MARLNLFVPKLFSQSPGSARAGSGAVLARLIARADCEIRAPVSIETALCAEFGFELSDEKTPPVADVTAAIDLAGAAGASGFVRADPVYLRADPGHLVLFDARSLDLTGREADAVLAHLNSGLEEHQVTLLRGVDQTRWYAALDCGADLGSFSPSCISGCHVDGHLPVGSSAAFLGRVMNEAQILLHDAEVNTQRRDRGLPPVNSVWFWGAGKLPAPRTGGPDVVVANDVLSAGLAKKLNRVWLERTDDVPAWLDRIQPGQSALVVIGAPTGAISEAPDTTLEEFEIQWCVPLCRALKTGRLRELHLITDRARFLITRRSLRRFWRRGEPLDVVKQKLAAG